MFDVLALWFSTEVILTPRGQCLDMLWVITNERVLMESSE